MKEGRKGERSGRTRVRRRAAPAPSVLDRRCRREQCRCRLNSHSPDRTFCYECDCCGFI